MTRGFPPRQDQTAETLVSLCDCMLLKQQYQAYIVGHPVCGSTVHLSPIECNMHSLYSITFYYDLIIYAIFM